MNYSNIFKKQTTLIVGSVCILLIVFMGVSYALFNKNLEGDKLVVTTGDLKITYTGGNLIGGEIIPLSDTDGPTNGSLYSFEINNEGTINSSYTITLSTDETVTGTKLAHQYIRLSYDGGAPVTLSTLTKMSGSSENNSVYLLKQAGITNGAVENHNLRVWISDSAPTSAVNSIVALKIKIASEVDTSNN